ncbi:MAG: hypothetical protein K8R21_08840, partial [Leptospira sp.]|nr:hypothetical protein [Leptospira sp.]
MFIYLDAGSICRPFDDITVIRNRLESDAISEIIYKLKKRKLTWKRSEILDAEINEINDPDKRIKIQNTYLQFPTEIQYDQKVRSLLTKVDKLGFDLLDALHICSAIAAKCEIFISTNPELVKK